MICTFAPTAGSGSGTPTASTSSITIYTRAILLQPDYSHYYAALATLYLRLGYPDHAKQTLDEALRFVTAPRTERAGLFELYGDVLFERGDVAASLEQYGRAREACPSCGGQVALSFKLGRAALTTKRARKNEGLAHLARFWKAACKGSLANRYRRECEQTAAVTQALSGGAP